MRIIGLTCLAMLAFAGNSLLNRAALADGAIGPATFAFIRILSGAVVLGLVFYFRERRLPAKPVSYLGPIGLFVYMFCFSYAYIALDAGYGALLLFGAVQIAMFVIARIKGQIPQFLEIAGSLIAFGGLIFLLYPSISVGGFSASVIMIAAGIGWAIFSVEGQKASSAIESSAISFLVIVPCALFVLLIAFGEEISAQGVILALISGAITSAIGYLIWYSVLPYMQVTTAAVIQLTVPVLAIIGGILILGETSDTRTWVSSVLVIAGVLLSVVSRQRKRT